MILQLDIGNTRTKWRMQRGGDTVERGVLSRAEEGLLPETATPPDAVWVSSVAGESLEHELQAAAESRWGASPWFARTEAAALGLHNSYEDPRRMGVDRWLAMLAAWQVRRGPVCVVDAGSALTIDFVDGGGQHLGGYILPGLQSMERALLNDTDRVRFPDTPRDRLEPGRSTGEAVYAGLLASQVGAVALTLDRQAEDFALVFSGGDGELLQRSLARGGDYRAELVLDGLALLGAREAPGVNGA